MFLEKVETGQAWSKQVLIEILWTNISSLMFEGVLLNPTSLQLYLIFGRVEYRETEEHRVDCTQSQYGWTRSSAHACSLSTRPIIVFFLSDFEMMRPPTITSCFVRFHATKKKKLQLWLEKFSCLIDVFWPRHCWRTSGSLPGQFQHCNHWLDVQLSFPFSPPFKIPPSLSL